MLLTGVRVLDLSRLLPGGYCTRLLQDAGADVLKVESPDGDPLRRMPGGAAMFDALHHGKRFLRVDWKTPPGRTRLWHEIEARDVLVEGFRPGVMERAGFGYQALKEKNPRLIYCAITGFGSTGRLLNHPGHDLNYLARSGALSLMPPSADGTPTIPGVQIADHAGGLQAAFLITAALASRAQTGHGSRVEVSMTQVARSWTALARAAGRAGAAGLPLTGSAPCYHVYRVIDGFLAVAALEPPFWAEFCRVIGREDLEARQADPTAIPEVAGILAQRTRSEWIQSFEGRDVCVEPCLGINEEDR